MSMFSVYASAEDVEPCAYVQADSETEAVVNAHRAMVDLGLTDTAWAEMYEE